MNESTPASAPQPLPPDAHLMQIGLGYFLSQATFVATKLRIADLLAEAPKSTSDLANAAGCNEGALYRILRALASAGVFTETEDRVFANTPASSLLQADAPHSLRELILWMIEEPHWAVYPKMLDSVRTGDPVWESVHGERIFPYLFRTNTELGDTFNRAMTSFSRVTIPAILDAYDFSPAKTIADIAGGYGHLLAAVLQKYPDANGILFDVREVIAGAPAMMESQGVAERVSLVEGDFLGSIPVEADVYMLKHIIHDWYDDTNSKILGNIRAAMPDHAKVLVIDAVVPPGNVPHFSKILDLEMLVAPGGMERTAAEFESLLTDSGFRMTRIIPTPSPVSIVEAEKA